MDTEGTRTISKESWPAAVVLEREQPLVLQGRAYLEREKRVLNKMLEGLELMKAHGRLSSAVWAPASAKGHTVLADAYLITPLGGHRVQTSRWSVEATNEHDHDKTFLFRDDCRSPFFAFVKVDERERHLGQTSGTSGSNGNCRKH